MELRRSDSIRAEIFIISAVFSIFFIYHFEKYLHNGIVHISIECSRTLFVHFNANNTMNKMTWKGITLDADKMPKGD